MGPYAWEYNFNSFQHSRTSSKRKLSDDAEWLPSGKAKENISPSLVDPNRHDGCIVPMELQDMHRSAEVFEQIHLNKSLSLMLPLGGATAGRILEHSAKVFKSLEAQHAPMTFKFGITHNPHFRWSNHKFGYASCLDKFQCMVIIFAAREASGPAFLEASLIREFGSAMAKLENSQSFCQDLHYRLIFDYIMLEPQHSQYIPFSNLHHLRYEGLQEREERWGYSTVW